MCRTSPRWTTRSSAGRASCGSTRPSSRACTSARLWTTCGRCAGLRGCIRARTRLRRPSHRPGSSACSRRAGRHQGAQLDAQLVEIAHRLGDRRGPACRGRASARSRMPHRPGHTCSGAGCRWSRCVRQGICTTRPPPSGAVRRPAGARSRGRCRGCRRAHRHDPGTRAAVAAAGCARSEGPPGRPSLGRPVPARDTTPVGAHP